jgi:hypothetical protein
MIHAANIKEFDLHPYSIIRRHIVDTCKESAAREDCSVYSVTTLMEERIQRTLSAFDNPEKLIQRKHRSSEILKELLCKSQLTS